MIIGEILLSTWKELIYSTVILVIAVSLQVILMSKYRMECYVLSVKF